MNFKNHSHGFGLISITLHWLMALLIIALFTVGLWMVDLSYYDPWYKQAPFFHKSVGVIVAMLYISRVTWRMINPPPPPIASIPRTELLLAKAMHLTLYIMMLGVFTSGYMISTADGRPIEVFNLFSIPAFVTPIENQEDIAGTFHYYLACSLIGLASLHAIAALKHHFYDKDKTLRRMTSPNLKE